METVASGNLSTDTAKFSEPCQCSTFGYCPRWQRYMMPVYHSACQGKITEPSRTRLMEHVAAHPNPAAATTHQMPGLIQQAKNFGKAFVYHGVNQFIQTTPEERDRRLAICHGCEFLSQGRCTACGCPIQKKTGWASETCPKNKWFPEAVTHRNSVEIVPDDDDLRYDSTDIDGLDKIADVPTFYDADGQPSSFPSLRDRIVVLLCGGPSLAQVEIDKLPDHVVTFGLNNVAQIAQSDLWMCLDSPASKFPRENWEDPEVHKLVPRGLAEEEVTPGVKVRDCPATHFFLRNYRFRSDRFLTEPTFSVGCTPDGLDELGQQGGRSVMLASLKAAIVMGCKKIIIVGADFHMTTDRPYAHDEAKDARACASNNSTFSATNNRLLLTRARLSVSGIQVVNATPGGNLNAFERAPLEVAIKALSR